MGALILPSPASILRARWPTWIPQGQSVGPSFIPRREVCPVRSHSNLYLPGCALTPCQATASARSPGIPAAGMVSLWAVALPTAPPSHLRHEAGMNSRLAEVLRISEEPPGSTSSRRSCVGSPCPGQTPRQHSGRAPQRSHVHIPSAGSSASAVGRRTRLHPTHPTAAPLMGDQPGFCLSKFLFLYIFFVLKRKA